MAKPSRSLERSLFVVLRRTPRLSLSLLLPPLPQLPLTPKPALRLTLLAQSKRGTSWSVRNAFNSSFTFSGASCCTQWEQLGIHRSVP